jgi:hypothetical protein
MNQTITTVYTQDGAPKTGLTPTIDIWQISNNTKVVDGEAMTEVGGGIYKYTFTTYNKDQEYSIICDGGVTLTASERYTYAVTDKIELIERILRNKQILQDGSTNNWVIYDDDGATALLTFSISDKNGGTITTSTTLPARKSRGT